MAFKSSISWTDSSWVTVTGCTRVSEGCRFCFAERLTATRLSKSPKYAGLSVLTPGGEARWTNEVRLHPECLDDPLHWRAPRRIFVNSMSDLFHEKVPFEFIDRVFAVMALCPQHCFQVLTKRPERMAEYFDTKPGHAIGRAADALISMKFCTYDPGVSAPVLHPKRGLVAIMTGGTRRPDWPLPNVMLGTSCEDQAAADARIPHLLRCPAAVRFLSLEPLLEPIDLDKSNITVTPGFFGSCLRWHHRGRCHEQEGVAYPTIDLVIVGAESGPGARPMDLAWARSVRDQCRAAGVALFFKQLSGPGGRAIKDIGQFPEDLRIQEWPVDKAAVAR